MCAFKPSTRKAEVGGSLSLKLARATSGSYPKNKEYINQQTESVTHQSNKAYQTVGPSNCGFVGNIFKLGDFFHKIPSFWCGDTLCSMLETLGPVLNTKKGGRRCVVFGPQTTHQLCGLVPQFTIYLHKRDQTAVLAGKDGLRVGFCCFCCLFV